MPIWSKYIMHGEDDDKELQRDSRDALLRLLNAPGYLSHRDEEAPFEPGVWEAFIMSSHPWLRQHKVMVDPPISPPPKEYPELKSGETLHKEGSYIWIDEAAEVDPAAMDRLLERYRQEGYLRDDCYKHIISTFARRMDRPPPPRRYINLVQDESGVWRAPEEE